MGDQLFSIFNEFLSNDSMMRVINLPVWDIIERIKSKIASSIEDAKTEENAARLKELLSKQDFLKQNMKFNGNRLLHVVAKDGSVETAMQLLKFRVNVNALNNNRKRPIFYAIQNSAEMVKMLLDNEISVNDCDLFYNTLIFGRGDTFEVIVNKRLLKVQNDLSQDAISKFEQNQKSQEKTSCKFDKLQAAINAFLQHKFHLEYESKFYPLLIFFAAKIFRKDILNIILDDCRKKLSTFMTNFEYFVENERYKLQAPEELNVRGFHGQTALHHAVIHQHEEVARLLLEEGADPDCHDDCNYTPLHYASYFGNEEMCRLLLSFGANVNPNFHNQLNPLNLVCDEIDTSSINLKLETRDFRRVRIMFNLKIMKLLLENGADPEITCMNGWSLLFNACHFGFVKGVKILLEYGANIRALDSHGNSILHHAACGSSLEMVDLLLDKGLDINLKNNFNKTPLLLGMEYGEEPAKIEYLVYRGANINAMGNNGKTAVHMAVSGSTSLITGSTYDIEFLLELGADWLILNIKETSIFRFYRLLTQSQKVLISFIALKETELRNHIKFYVGNTPEKLTKAREYFQESKFEITKLKTTTFSEEFRLSYFDFLTKDFYTSVQIAKNLDVKMFFHSGAYKKEFPCYKSLLKFRFAMTKNLEDYVDKTFDFISSYANLPPEIVEMIISHLCSIDFRVFGRVLLNKRF